MPSALSVPKRSPALERLGTIQHLSLRQCPEGRDESRVDLHEQAWYVIGAR